MSKYITAYNYKRYLMIDVSLIVLCLFLLISYSYAFYSDTISLPLANTKVGEFIGNKKDLSVIIYIKDTDTYRKVKDIPLENYSFTKYECLNDSIITYDDTQKTVNMEASQIDECKVYFDYEVLE